MIDFKNGSILKLKPIDVNEGSNLVQRLLINNEEVFVAFKTIRDIVVFTNKRVISINIQGITGSKKDFTSLPYSKVQAFSIETAGTFDLDCELELWYSGLGKVRFEFKGNFDICSLNKIISEYIL